MIAMRLVVPNAEHLKFSSKLISIAQGTKNWTVSPEWHSMVASDGKGSDEACSFDSFLSDATFEGKFPDKGRVHSPHRAEIRAPQGLILMEPFTIIVPSSNESSATTLIFAQQVADYRHTGAAHVRDSFSISSRHQIGTTKASGIPVSKVTSLASCAFASASK